MKNNIFKTILVSCIVICLSVSSAGFTNCTADNEEIPFRYLYRGFTSVSWEETGKISAFSEASAGGAWLIEDDEALRSFGNIFAPGAPFYEEYDFTRDYMLARISFGAKPSYNISSDVESVFIENDYRDMRFSNDYTKYIYALNSEALHYCVTILIISREDLPADPANPVYIDKGVTEDRLEIEAIANRFAEAYFTGDTSTIGTYLVSPYQYNSHDVFSEGGEISSEKAIKGLEAVGDEQIGARKTVWVEFKTSKYPDMYIYLRIDFIKHEDGWKVDFYGLEI